MASIDIGALPRNHFKADAALGGHPFGGRGDAADDSGHLDAVDGGVGVEVLVGEGAFAHHADFHVVYSEKRDRLDRGAASSDAAVAATSELIAKKAVRKIKVEYEVLDHVMDPREAAQPGAPILHDDHCTFKTGDVM